MFRLQGAIIPEPEDNKDNLRNYDDKLKLSCNHQSGIQMKKLHLIKSVVLLLTMATLSGCMLVPVPVGGHDNGQHRGNHGQGDHHRD